MTTISNRIVQIINEQAFADPFKSEFDSSKLKNEFGDAINEDENSILRFLIICNEIFNEYEANVYAIFDKLRLSPQDLREFCFIKINKYFLEFSPKLFEQTKKGVTLEVENANFTKFTNGNGQEVSAQLVVEIGGDILAMLLNFSHRWSPTDTSFESATNLNSDFYDRLFHIIWIQTNIILNLRSSAYDVVKYENGKIIFLNENEIKIENGLNATLFLKSAGLIRASNNTNEFYFSFMQFYDKAFENRIGVSGFEIAGNVLRPIKGKSDLSEKAKADSSLFVFYPHFLDDKFEYFDGLTLHNLLDLLVLIEECIEKLNRENITEYFDRQLEEIPIKFKETELVNFLSEATGFKTETVEKFIFSITADSKQPYFWREPLYKLGDFLYFSLAAIAAPNHVLFLDKWTTYSGFDLDNKERKFTKFILKELSESKQIEFKFDFIKLSKLKINEAKFQNNILIETASLLILLEIKLFDFPIESSEIDFALTRLVNSTFDVEEKAKQILENFDGQKELIKIIVPNYTTFSGLVINNIPIADLTLFKNYVTVGYIRRAATTFHNEKPIVNETGIITYYKNENEFNKNFKGFFYNPIPIRHILERLHLKEVEITPEFMNPKFIVDMVDHVTEEELMETRMSNLSGMLNNEYFAEPEDETIKDALDQSIIYSLTEIFSKLSYSEYESYHDRIELYHNISKTKLLGFVHLAFYILKALEKLNGKKIKADKRFELVECEPDEFFKIIKEKVFLSGQIRLSEFKIDDGTLSVAEEKKIVSHAIDILCRLTPTHFGEDVIESSMLLLALLNGLSHKYEVEYEFYSACSNMVDALNYAHKYQRARDFCEEVLILSIKNQKHYYGWNILFRCYSAQKSQFDSAINGCLFLSSLSVLPEIPHYLAVEALYEALKFFRNFRFNEFAKYTYENLQHFDLSEYDKQKISISYFYCFLQDEIQRDINVLDQVINYVEKKIDDIVSFGEHGVIPWLAYFYNIERFKSTRQISYNRNTQKYIDKFESSVDPKSVEAIRLKILGNAEKPKEHFISSLLNAFETRSIQDFVHEIQHLSLAASNLLQSAIKTEDIDSILLAGLVFNDQSFSFQEISINQVSVLPLSKPVNKELELRLNNYKYYLLSRINLSSKQLLIWIFEDLGKVYFVSVDSSKQYRFSILENWSIHEMNTWLKEISSFSFDARKDKDGKPICEFSNPRGERDYNNIVQEEDRKKLLQALSFTNTSILKCFDEILICSSIEMSCFPHNLIETDNDFVASHRPICNVISIERFIENCRSIYLDKNYSVSAWIPVDDKEFVISLGFELLKPTLERIEANIFTSKYPKEIIKSDLNIFMAHGITDRSGFKAVYTNPREKKAIAFPFEVFGKGKVAILFVCNSGSSNEELFSNSIVSFSGELLKSGYESVVAPFWPFDFTMSKIWLEEFLLDFNQGYSINESVWMANNRLSKYDNDTSNLFYAPAGCLAMHLYGNPNVYVES